VEEFLVMVSIIPRRQVNVEGESTEVRKRRSLSHALILVGTSILFFQLIGYIQAGSWYSLSLFNLIEFIGGEDFAHWLSGESSFSVLKATISGLLEFVEIGVLLVLVGFLIQANQD